MAKTVKSAMHNRGFYIAPFKIKFTKSDEFREHLNTAFEMSDRFDKTQYFLPYVKGIFPVLQNDKKIGANKAAYYTRKESETQKPLNFGKVKGISDEQMKTVQLKNTDLIVFSEYLGFIVIEIDYGNLTVEEIAEFTFQFRRKKYLKYDGDSETANSNLYEYCCEYLGDNEKYTELFFSDAFNNKGICDVLQFVYYPYDEETDEVRRNKFLLGRGFRAEYDTYNSNPDSEVDLSFNSYNAVEWRGCQQTLAAFVTKSFDLEKKTSELSENDRFYFNTLFMSIKNDYLFMYLLLLNQRYSLVYLLGKLVETKTDEIERMREIETKLDDFNVFYSFKVISNELVYQNLYNQMLRILDIDSLIIDVQETRQKLETRHRHMKEDSDAVTNKILFALGVLVICSSLIDAYTFLHEAMSWPHAVSLTISIIISVSVILIAVRNYFKYRKNTGKKKKKNKTPKE